MEATHQSNHVSRATAPVDNLTRIPIEAMETIITPSTNTPYDGLRVTVG
jgi:hypothetical protein